MQDTVYRVTWNYPGAMGDKTFANKEAAQRHLEKVLEAAKILEAFTSLPGPNAVLKEIKLEDLPSGELVVK